MPVMDLYLSASFLPIQLSAYMLHPTDEQARDTFLAHKLAEIGLQLAKENGEDEISLSANTLELILGSRGSNTHEADERSVLAGSVSGQIILNLIEMQASGIEPSVKKAIYLAKAFFSEAESKAGGTVRLQALKNYYAHWSRYKTVAHLWAAVYFMAEGIVSLDAVAEEPLRFAALASAVLDLAKGLSNKNIKGPIIEIDGMWTLPDEIELPAVQVRCRGLSEDQIELLEGYSAREYTDY